MLTRTLLAVAVSIIALAAPRSARPAGATPPAKFATLQQKIFKSCASASCHGTVASGGLNLSRSAAYANLVDVPAANEAARAAGRMRVVPGDPDHSFLLDKLGGPLTRDEGSPMPLAGPPLSAKKIDLIRRWIAAGASPKARF